MVTSWVSPLSFLSLATTSSTTCSPAAETDSTVHLPSRRNGTMMRCVNTPSGTVPSVSPATTTSPTFATGVNAHFLSRGSAFKYLPRCRKKPHSSASFGSGFCRPSKTWVKRPGPSSTDKSSPVNSTSSPVLSPVVSSNTWSSA